MIPVTFDSVLPQLIQLGQLALTADFPGVQMRRQTPTVRPQLFVLLLSDFGSRTQEIHKLERVRAQAWATFPDGRTDWDKCLALAKAVQFFLETANTVVPHISAVTDSNGSYPIRDESGVEYRFSTVEYQLRGAAA